VVVRWVEEKRTRVEEVEKIIAAEWEKVQGRSGPKLFDGPMCRLENCVAGRRLELELSPTSYKVFWGTNLNNSWIGEKYGAGAMANAVGVSCALESADGFLMLGRRNAAAAFYPSRVHPFAGTLETLDVFGDARRELDEELGLGKNDISGMACLAIIEDASIAQPELVFGVKTLRTRRELEGTLDEIEHDSVVAVEKDAKKAAARLRDAELTPVAMGTILLWGKGHFGSEWFDGAARAVNLGES
jgi:8-oxo-dGTP pyrophosphatase MutT (NUDIX family)